MTINRIIPANTIKKYTATGINAITKGDLIWKVDGLSVAKTGTFLERSLYYAGTDNNYDVFELDTDKWVITGEVDNYGLAGITTVNNGVLTNTLGNAFDYPDIGGTVRRVSACKVNSTKFAIAYTRQVGGVEKVSCVIVTVSGTTKTHGTPVDIDTVSGTANKVSICLVDTDKIAVAYRDYSGSQMDLKCAVATISGTTPTFGASVSADTNISNPGSDAYETVRITSVDTDKIAIAYSYGTTKGYCIVATISSTTPTFGTRVEFENAEVRQLSIAKLNTDKIIIAYSDDGNSAYGTAIVGTISTTTPTFGTAVVFESTASGNISINALTTSSFFITYGAGTNKAIAGFVTETNKLTFSTAYTISRIAGGNYFKSGVGLTSKQVLCTYIENNNGYAQLSDLNPDGVAESSEDYATRNVAVSLF